MSQEHVLVIGYRQGLIRALRNTGTRFSLWCETPRRLPPGVTQSLFAPIPESREEIKARAAQFLPSGPYTHVIAGTESAVYAASLARRVLKCRKSLNTVVLKCHDKLLMKSHLLERGIAMAPYLTCRRRLNPELLLEELGVPVVVKERRLSGGRGIRFARSAAELKEVLRPGKIFERYIDAPEASVECFVDERKIRFVNITQYLTKGHTNLVPSHLSPDWQDQLLRLNERVIQALGIRWGITHLEVYLTESGPWFGEIALRPPGGYIMALLSQAYGFDAWEAFVAVELGRPFAFPASPNAWTAAQVLHPGAGVVERIEGEQTLSRTPGVSRVRLKIKAGDAIAIREGVGQDVGYILYRGTSPEAVRRSIDEVARNFRIVLR